MAEQIYLVLTTYLIYQLRMTYMLIVISLQYNIDNIVNYFDSWKIIEILIKIRIYL